MYIKTTRSQDKAIYETGLYLKTKFNYPEMTKFLLDNDLRPTKVILKHNEIKGCVTVNWFINNVIVYSITVTNRGRTTCGNVSIPTVEELKKMIQ
jgi:hypothetical protein